MLVWVPLVWRINSSNVPAAQLLLAGMFCLRLPAVSLPTPRRAEEPAAFLGFVAPRSGVFVASAGPGVKPECACNDVNSSPRGQVECVRRAEGGCFLRAKREFDWAPRLFWWHWGNYWSGSSWTWFHPVHWRFHLLARWNSEWWETSAAPQCVYTSVSHRGAEELHLFMFIPSFWVKQELRPMSSSSWWRK